MSVFLGTDRVTELKSELKSVIQRRNHIDDNASHLDCGNSLVKVFYPEIGVLEARANVILDELSKLDPACPKFRYTV